MKTPTLAHLARVGVFATPPRQDAMLRAINLCKHHGQGQARTPVLREVSFTIEPGELVAIMGTSGSGKTTLLNIIGGLDTQHTGELRLDDKPLSGLSDAALAKLRRERFGFVFQQFHLLDHLSALENVMLPAYFASGPSALSDADARARARDLLAKMGLSDRADAMPAQLSGGQKQRVAIARALFHSPAILLCDEPTGSLDRATGLHILDLFEQLNARDGLTVIIITHEAHIAARAARVLRLEDGRLISDTRQTPEREAAEPSPETTSQEAP